MKNNSVKVITNMIMEILKSEEGKAIDKTYNIKSKLESLTGEEKTDRPHEIFEYIRRRKGGKNHKVGIVWGTVVGDNKVIKIGWSKCNLKAGDVFNAKQGMELAKSRAYNETPTTTPIPICIHKQIRQFGARCVRYFKDASKLEIPV